MTSTPDTASGRRRQVALAGHLGDRATAEAALDDTDDSIRELAIGALERLGGQRRGRRRWQHIVGRLEQRRGQGVSARERLERQHQRRL